MDDERRDANERDMHTGGDGRTRRPGAVGGGPAADGSGWAPGDAGPRPETPDGDVVAGRPEQEPVQKPAPQPLAGPMSRGRAIAWIGVALVALVILLVIAL